MMIFQKIKITRKKIFAIIIIILVLLFAIFFKKIRYGGLVVFSYFDTKVFFIKKDISDFRSNFKTNQELVQENNRLLKTISDYEDDLISYKIIKQENDKISNAGSANISSSRVISKGNIASSSNILIQNNNYKIKDEVYAGSIFLGYVSEIHADNAVVELQSRNGYKMQALLENGLEVTLNGLGNQTFAFDVPTGEKIEVGNIIKKIGSGNVIASVREIYIDPKTPFKTVYSSYPVNLNYMDLVDVKTNE